MIDPIGSVCFSDDDKVAFWLEHGPVCYGEIVQIPVENIVYYGRVFHSESGTTTTVEEQLIYASGKDDFGPYSKFRKISIQLFLEREESKIRPPTLNPPYGSKVFRLTNQDRAYIRLTGSLPIGKLRIGKMLSGLVGLNPSFISRHSCISGKTGSGKTNAELVLNAGVISANDTVALIFDFTGELWEGKDLGGYGLKNVPSYPPFSKNINYYSSTQEGNQKLVIGLYSLYPSNLRLIFSDVSFPQVRLAERLFQKFGESWINQSINAYEEGGSKNIKKLLVHGARPDVINALMQKLCSPSIKGNLWEISDRNFVNYIVSNLSTGVSCLADVSDLSEKDKLIAVEMTVMRVANFWRKNWEENHDYWKTLPSLLITLEEAHQFLHKRDPEHPRKTFFADIALQYRKYRVGLLAITPRPSLIDEDVFANLWTKIIMKTDLKKDRNFITNNTPFLEYSDSELKLLARGEALLISEPQIEFAVPIKIIYYPDYLNKMGVRNISEFFTKPKGAKYI